MMKHGIQLNSAGFRLSFFGCAARFVIGHSVASRCKRDPLSVPKKKDRNDDIYPAIASRLRILLRELTLSLFSDSRYTKHDTSLLPRSYRGVIATLRRDHLCHQGNGVGCKNLI
jgi:hypothetical protein